MTLGWSLLSQFIPVIPMYTNIYYTANIYPPGGGILQKRVMSYISSFPEHGIVSVASYILNTHALHEQNMRNEDTHGPVTPASLKRME